MTFSAKGISSLAVASLGQLFVNGPVWDGNLISKSGRNELVNAGLAFRVSGGWNALTPEGVVTASEWDFAKVESDLDVHWHRKACALR